MLTPGHEASDVQILSWLHREYEAPFSGWDFSYIRGRRHQEAAPWDYDGYVTQHINASQPESIIDMSTGGGEHFSAILKQTGFTGTATATEGWSANVPVAAERLQPLDCTVVHCAAESLPFKTDSFDLIINRHGAEPSTAAAARVLNRGGHFITQQVGSATNRELEALVGYPRTDFGGPDTVQEWAGQFSDMGFEVIRADSALSVVSYSDLGALVYMLKAVPWEAVGFSIDDSADRLVALHRNVALGRIHLDLTFETWLLAASQLGSE